MRGGGRVKGGVNVKAKFALRGEVRLIEVGLE